MTLLGKILPPESKREYVSNQPEVINKLLRKPGIYEEYLKLGLAMAGLAGGFLATHNFLETAVSGVIGYFGGKYGGRYLDHRVERNVRQVNSTNQVEKRKDVFEDS